MGINNGWYVIYVKHKHEKRVYQELTAEGIESFLPITTVVSQWSDRIKKVQKPLFSNYVFVKINSKNDFYGTLTLDSVYSFVCFGDKYGMVLEKEINNLKLIVGEKDLSEINVETPPPNIGDKFIFQSGKLKGLECEVFRFSDKNKISVRLDSIYQNISATIPAHYLQTAIRIN